MNVVKHPSRILRLPSLTVDKNERGWLSAKLIHHYRSIPCAGIAAPQINERKRAFIARGKLYINPEIEHRSPGWYLVAEGCLSLDLRSRVKRYDSIIMSWTDEFGQCHREGFSNYSAQVIQHEYDHIDGVLICDYSAIGAIKAST